jgi:hypothetical protein
MDDIKTLKLDSPEYKTIKEIVLGHNINWTYEPISSSDKFPFLCHTILGRNGQIFSPSAYKACSKLTKDICNELKISFEKPLRMAVNFCYANKESQADWHIDHPEIEHKVLLVYFNKTSLGNTIIAKTKYNKGIPDAPVFKSYPDKDIEEETRIGPCEDTAVIFDGMRWHNTIFPDVGERRITLVVTFI